MKVTLMNPGTVRDLYKNHGQFACVCYDTPEKYAERVGKNCGQSGHLSGSRCEYIKFRVEDIDRGTAEQFLRHEIGVSVPYEYQDNYSFTELSDMITVISPDNVVKNMASFRYIDKAGFTWETPASVRNHPAALIKYEALMKHINRERKDIKALLEEGGTDAKKATEDANMVLPRATKSEFVIGFTPEAFIHLCHKRLCARAQEYIRQCTMQMVEAVREANYDFAKECVPQCEHLLWCPEKGRSCGRYPTKEEARQLKAERDALSEKLQKMIAERQWKRMADEPPPYCNTWYKVFTTDAVELIANYTYNDEWISECYSDITQYVTHWLPLDEGPKEETQNAEA